MFASTRPPPTLLWLASLARSGRSLTSGSIHPDAFGARFAYQEVLGTSCDVGVGFRGFNLLPFGRADSDGRRLFRPPPPISLDLALPLRWPPFGCFRQYDLPEGSE
jgi:hypothetical protein